VLLLAGGGCGGGDDDESRPRAAPAKPSCPAAWRAGWQKLANRVAVPVYCPSWMPNPLTGEIGGPWDNGVSVDPDRSYLVSFLWHEAGSGDVHVNFRGYPGRVAVPRCLATETVAGKTRRTPVACFSDPQGLRRVGRLDVTVYTVNRDADQWHVLYAWRRNGSLYTVSQHVAPPLTYGKVVRSLDRIVETLAPVQPRS
jgi:hypothetical protein